ncbi:hypothetical protein B9Z55_020668 [Caenorhabditis nigoni]|nr:hypothetical protein B9Z55_020668 [Caenorhabditis nigoni]
MSTFKFLTKFWVCFSKSKINVINLPENATKKVLEYLDFQSILILRKTCKYFRNFIDDFQPDFHLFSIEISVNFKEISLKIFSNNFEHWKKNYVEYNRNSNGGYSVVWFKRNEEKHKIMDSGDFVTAFLEDLKIIFQHQKSVLNSFSVCFEEEDNVAIKEELKRIFQNKNHFLKSGKLRMIVKDQNDVLPVLEKIDPHELKFIEIHRIGTYEEDPLLLVDHLGEMDQWKNAKDLRIEGFCISNYFDHISHFKHVKFSLETITLELISGLKDGLQKCPTQTRYTFYFQQIEKEKEVLKFIGIPYSETICTLNMIKKTLADF